MFFSVCKSIVFVVMRVFNLFFNCLILVISLSISFEFLSNLFNKRLLVFCISLITRIIYPFQFAVYLQFIFGNREKFVLAFFEIPIGRVGDIGGSVDCRIFSKQS